MIRNRIELTGIVQGVGFRPFVYNLAKSLDLKGWVNNAGGNVVIEAEGSGSALADFVRRLKTDAPPLAVIKEIYVKANDLAGYPDFKILESNQAGGSDIFISPDISTCDKCTEELFNEKDKRYLYPFINCTNCGPRFTIIKDTPYDRARTTMSVYPMCGGCIKEFTDPSDRRYHAQPLSCHECGPVLQLLDKNGKQINAENIIPYTINLLADGKIVAIKGLGGYHLACDASNSSAVAELRQRKIREDKPFAIMVRNCETAYKYCHISSEEKKLLESEKRPIVLLKKKDDCGLPAAIAPSNSHLGVMLPYTPVHLLLFNYPDNLRLAGAGMPFDALVMTSGNRSSEPIYYKDSDAVENLNGIADYFLTNNREIYTRVDDTVTRVFRERELIIRRSRGYAPMPVRCEVPAASTSRYVPVVLATGGELKNTFCLNKGAEFYISHHIGDLENYETLRSFEEGIQYYRKLFGIKPSVVAYDLHPEYLSSKYALSLDFENKIGIQHHHAHIASCMADNGLQGNVIGVAFDGSGYGEDGNIWGGEFFTGNYREFTRQGHLDYVNMPGGAAAVREPWRMAAAYLYHAYGRGGLQINIKQGTARCMPSSNKDKLDTVFDMIEKNVNSPRTSSMGRLFDAVSSLLGIRHHINYEGQAAVELEFASDSDTRESYGFSIYNAGEIFQIDTRDIIKGIISDINMEVAVNRISSKFHNTIAGIVLKSCEHIREKAGFERVVLSGGVFQNMALLERSVLLLEKAGFKTYTHSRAPANDGGISLGQAVIAAARYGGNHV
ncbi:MAG: carbamoyltransferase HypF [Peptococcaceae bacterium]|nr:carbamoyltransferase HypF [Peptococcaceae bacterium]